MIVFSNGRFHPQEDPAVTLTNGGFLHGNGVFTTLRLHRGQPTDLADHVSRLKDHGRALHLTLPLGLDQLGQVISELMASNGLQDNDSRLRISLTKDGEEDFLSLVPGHLPPDLDSWKARGISALSLGPSFQRTFLPGLKTLNYLPSMMALEEAGAQGCAEAIVSNPEGRLLEGAVSNLFLVQEDVLMTPEDDGSILSGLTRRRVLELARAAGIEVREGALFAEDLSRSREVFLTNSVREIVPVVTVDNRVVADGRPGRITRLLQSLFHPHRFTDS